MLKNYNVEFTKWKLFLKKLKFATNCAVATNNGTPNLLRVDMIRYIHPWSYNSEVAYCVKTD